MKEGAKDDRKKKINTNLLIMWDLKMGLLAMRIMARYPASIVSQMIATAEIEEESTLYPTLHIPYKSLRAKLSEQSIRVEETIEIEI